MKRVISEESALLLESAEAVLNRRHDRRRFRAFHDEGEGFDPVFWQEMAELGWLRLRLPENLDGLGLTSESGCLLAELFGERLLPDPFIAASLMPSLVLAHAAENPNARQIASAMGSGEQIVILADGPVLLDDAADLVARAPTMVPNGIVLMLMKLRGEATLVALDSAARGITVRRQPRPDGGVAATFHVLRQTLDEADVLLRGTEAERAWSRATQEGVLACSAALAGLARGAFNLALAYVTQRVQFGQTIASFQAIQHRLADLRIGLELAETSWRSALRDLQDDSAVASLHAAKARCSDVAMDVSKAAIQLHGAMGYTDECDAGLYLKAAMHLSGWLGSAASHRAAYWRLAQSAEAVLG